MFTEHICFRTEHWVRPGDITGNKPERILQFLEPAIQFQEVGGREETDGETVIKTHLVYTSANDRTVVTFHRFDGPCLHSCRIPGGKAIYTHPLTLIRLPPGF